jgi:ATP/maltotriose-dependent transcriptional regulator MalT
VAITRSWRTRRLLAQAWQALLALDIGTAELLASEVERLQEPALAGADAPDCATAVFRAALLAVRDDSTAVLGLTRQARQPCADVECRSLATMIGRWAHWQAGELSEFHSAGRIQWYVGSRRCRAITAIFDLNLEAAVEFGRLRLAVSSRLAAEALGLARSRACGESAAGLLAATLVAQATYEQGQLDEAEMALRCRMSLIRAAATIECAARAYIILARIAVHRLRGDSGLALLRDAQALGEKRSWPRLIAAALAEQARILLDEGQEAAALSRMAELETLLSSHPTTSTTARDDIELQYQLTRLRSRQRHAPAAETAMAIGSLRQSVIGRSDLRLALEMHLISVAAYARNGEIFTAQERLIDALDIGAANGLCMTFVDAGPVVRKLLAELCHDPSVSDERALELRPYIHTLLGRCPNPPAAPARQSREANRQPLTARESGVLRLIASGLSNKRIARRLDITPETVKSHAKSIFAKLAARTRAQAVAHAETLGFI